MARQWVLSSLLRCCRDLSDKLLKGLTCIFSFSTSTHYPFNTSPQPPFTTSPHYTFPASTPSNAYHPDTKIYLRSVLPSFYSPRAAKLSPPHPVPLFGHITNLQIYIYIIPLSPAISRGFWLQQGPGLHLPQAPSTELQDVMARFRGKKKGSSFGSAGGDLKHVWFCSLGGSLF